MARAPFFFRAVAISSDHQPAGDLVPDCSQHAVKFKFHTLSVSSVLTQLQTLDIRKATGPDGISACFLKSVAEEFADPPGADPRGRSKESVDPPF